MKASALVFRRPYTPVVESFELPAPQPGEVVVQVIYSGVSIGTEMSIISGERTHNGTFPLIPGYMASGTIVAVGDGVPSRRIGERVVSWGGRVPANIAGVWAAHMSHHVTSAAAVTPLPAETDERDAAMWIPPRVGLHAVDMANIKSGDVVLISGQGLIGQFFGQWARARGAVVIALEPDALRAKLSCQYVTPHVLDPRAGELEARLLAITGGAYPDVVVEATANPKLVGQATGFLRKMNARMIFLSWYPENVTLRFADFHNYEVTALFPMGSGDDATTGRAVLRGFGDGSIVMGDNLTDCYSFDQAATGYARLAAGDRSVMGMVIDWRNA